MTASFDGAKSPSGATGADILALRPSLAPDSLAQRYAPIVYGRDLPEVPGPYENNHTDVPLLTYHEQRADAAGNTVLEYTVIWSNEDGGTNTPALMARWGRTTDIEWVYRSRSCPPARSSPRSTRPPITRRARSTAPSSATTRCS